jgi:multimeric flavodoxin WrbA
VTRGSLSAVALVCTLKPSPARSSSEHLARQLLDALRGHGVRGDLVRVVDHDVRPGVEVDMGGGDAWPELRARVLAADILVLATPTWMGHPSSVAARVLERLDAELAETDEDGRPLVEGKVAITAVVGNEDGAHLVSAEVFQALDDVGFTIPSQAVAYWNGEAMGSVDYIDLPGTPEAVASTIATAARNAAHLARLLAASPYPAE